MNHVRIVGDPFAESAASSQLRSFVRQALGAGLQVSLSLAAVTPRPPAAGERSIALTDGVRDFVVGTMLPPAEIELLLRAAGQAVAATAPLLVFAEPEQLPELVQTAGWQWPLACVVLPARAGVTALEWIDRIRAELRWAGSEHPPHAREERELSPWLSLPLAAGDGPFVAVGGTEFGAGIELVIESWCRHFAAAGPGLRLVLPRADAEVVDRWRQRLLPYGDRVEILLSPFEPAHARSAAAVVLPWRRCHDTRDLVLALASGRPVCVSRFATTAEVVDRVGICLPIGGRNQAATAAEAEHFAPDANALLVALRQAIADPGAAAAIGRRAREHVIEHLVAGRPAAPPKPVLRSDRPRVVLEAPVFETSSTSELTLALAQALVRRARVDVSLRPSGTFRGPLSALRARAPELEALLCRTAPRADLWLSAGWPPRVLRPDCRRWALRIDWEYGALPTDLLPHTTQDADTVIVHSDHTAGAVAAAGRARSSLAVVPHGVDAAMSPAAVPDPELMAWKGDLPAVLFCGGMIWRKGLDVFLRAVLAAQQAGARFCIVIKTVGRDQHYGRFHLGELVARFARTAGTPPLRVIDRDLTRAELASTYTACDLLLHPYRGEGFCLPVLEARACGLPVLATAGGATDALMVGPGAVPIPAQRRAVDLPGAHAGTPWVLEPDAEATTALLLRALADRDSLRRQARGFANSVRAAYSWEAAAESIERLAFAARADEPVVTLPQVPPRSEPVLHEPRGAALRR